MMLTLTVTCAALRRTQRGYRSQAAAVLSLAVSVTIRASIMQRSGMVESFVEISKDLPPEKLCLWPIIPDQTLIRRLSFGPAASV